MLSVSKLIADVECKENRGRKKEKARKEGREEREETENERDKKKYGRQTDEEEEEEERRDGSCRGWNHTKTAQNTQTGVLQ